MKHPIRRRIMFLAFQGLRALIRVVPEGAAHRLGASLGALAYAAIPSQRRLTHQHLDQALGLPAAERRRVAREVYANLGRTFLEWLWMPRLSAEELQRRVRCEGLEHLRHALAQGRGAIIVTAHFGNWEVIAQYVGALGLPGTVLARRLRYPEYESFLVEMRQARGIETLTRGSAKDLIRALRANRILGLLPDQDVATLDGIHVPFLGRPAHTPIGPAELSLMTGAPLIPCFIIREGRTFRLAVEPPVPVPSASDRAEAVRELTMAWSAVVERYIRQYPGHWVWMHRRWKTQPESAAVVSPAGPRPPAEGGRTRIPKPGRDQLGPARDGAHPAFALLAALVLGLTGCGSKAGQGADRSPDQEMDRFTLSSFRADDTRKWELQGQGAVVEGKVISVLKPNGVGYDQARSARMTAGAAQVNQDSRYIRLEHEATIHTSDGLWFTSPVLYWMPDVHRFETDNPVRIETDRMLLRGRGSHGSTALKHATILRDIELVMPPGGGQGAPGAGGPLKHVTITCDGPLEFDYEHHIATFRNNVRVQDASGDLYSDVLIAYLNQAGRTIRYAEATGRVRIVQQHNTATSHKAVYQPSLGKITLVGRPSLLVYPSGDAEPSLGLMPAPAPPAGGAAATAAGTR